MLFAGLTGGIFASADAQTVASSVAVTNSASPDLQCNKVVLSAGEDGDSMSIYGHFLIRNLPGFNNYRADNGNARLESDHMGLELVGEQVATWLILVDVSDPSGRAQTIRHSAELATRLVSLMSPVCKVRILAVAGTQKVLADTEILKPIMNEGKDISPIYVWNGSKAQYSNQLYAGIIETLSSRISEVQPGNTNLWIGVARALKEQMPECSAGLYENLPRGVILISDGVDESNSSPSDFTMLVDTAKKMEIPIHTIAVPHKDKGAKYHDPQSGKSRTATDTDRGKGYAAMQRLSLDTGALSLNDSDFLKKIESQGKRGKTNVSYVFDVDKKDSVDKLDGMLRSTSSMVLKMQTPIDNIVAGHALRITLRNGNSTVCQLEVPQEQLGIFVAENALRKLMRKRSEIPNPYTEEQFRACALEMYSIFEHDLLPLTLTEPLFSQTKADCDYARRVKDVLLHVKNTSRLMDRDDARYEIGCCLINVKHPLPEPPKEDTNINVNNNIPTQGGPVTINNATTGDGSEEVGDTPKLVWWVVGIGGAFACVIVFIIIIRSLSRNDDDDEPAVRGPRPDAGAGAVPTPPLATLDDAKQPGQSWAVRKTSVSVGRSASADVRLPSGHVSNIHFTLYREATGQWMVKDANSTNGTIVNGSKITTATALNSGDIVSVADMQLVFRIK